MQCKRHLTVYHLKIVYVIRERTTDRSSQTAPPQSGAPVALAKPLEATLSSLHLALLWSPLPHLLVAFSSGSLTHSLPSASLSASHRPRNKPYRPPTVPPFSRFIPLIQRSCFIRHSAVVRYVVLTLSLASDSYRQLYSRVNMCARKADRGSS